MHSDLPSHFLCACTYVEMRIAEKIKQASIYNVIENKDTGMVKKAWKHDLTKFVHTVD